MKYIKLFEDLNKDWYEDITSDTSDRLEFKDRLDFTQDEMDSLKKIAIDNKFGFACFINRIRFNRFKIDSIQIDKATDEWYYVYLTSHKVFTITSVISGMG